MTRVPGPSLVLVAILTMAGTAGCRLQPPDVPAPRMIEPQLLEPTPKCMDQLGDSATSSLCKNMCRDCCGSPRKCERMFGPRSK